MLACPKCLLHPLPLLDWSISPWAEQGGQAVLAQLLGRGSKCAVLSRAGGMQREGGHPPG